MFFFLQFNTKTVEIGAVFLFFDYVEFVVAAFLHRQLYSPVLLCVHMIYDDIYLFKIFITKVMRLSELSLISDFRAGYNLFSEL